MRKWPYQMVLLLHIVVVQIYFNIFNSGLYLVLGVISALLLQWALGKYITDKLKDGPVKMFSLIPLPLGHWCFIYYIMDYKTIMSPEDLFTARIMGEPITEYEKFAKFAKIIKEQYIKLSNGAKT